MLVVTAVAAEAEACAAGGADVLVGGVGPAAAGAAAGYALGRHTYDAVLSAGIGGGFGLPDVVGSLAVAARAVFADLGAESESGFAPLPELARTDYPSPLAGTLAERTGARGGTVLTVATVTGTQGRAQDLLTRYPDAVAEAMEGAAVAAAAAVAGVPFGEVRAISNVVGPRDRSAWRIPEALAALKTAFTAIGDLS